MHVVMCHINIIILFYLEVEKICIKIRNIVSHSILRISQKPQFLQVCSKFPIILRYSVNPGGVDYSCWRAIVDQMEISFAS